MKQLHIAVDTTTTTTKSFRSVCSMIYDRPSEIYRRRHHRRCRKIWAMKNVSRFFLFYYFVFGFSINIYVYKNASLFVFRCGVGFDGLIGNSFLGIILLLVSFDSLKRFGLWRIKRLEPHNAYNIPIDCINKSCHDLGFNRILNVFFCLSQQRT